MGISDKVIDALLEPLHADYIHLDDDGGITGYVVSPDFEGLSSLDRQALIERALRSATAHLSREEYRKVLMIAALTPEEYEAAGSRIVVERVQPLDDGTIEVVLQGGCSEAAYVSGTLQNRKGISTSQPQRVRGPMGTMMRLVISGDRSAALTKNEVLARCLKGRFTRPCRAQRVEQRARGALCRRGSLLGPSHLPLRWPLGEPGLAEVMATKAEPLLRSDLP